MKSEWVILATAFLFTAATCTLVMTAFPAQPAAPDQESTVILLWHPTPAETIPIPLALDQIDRLPRHR